MGCFADLLQVLHLVALVTEEDPPRLSLDVYVSKRELTASETNSSDPSFLYDHSDSFSFKLGPKVTEDPFPFFGKAWRTPSSPDLLPEKEKKEDKKDKKDIGKEEEVEKKEKKKKKKIMGSVGIVAQVAKAFKAALGKNAKKKIGAYDYEYSGSNSFELGHLALENPGKSGEETQLLTKSNTNKQPEAKEKSRVASYDAASDSDSDCFELDILELEAALSRRRSESNGTGQGNERDDSSSSEKTEEGKQRRALDNSTDEADDESSIESIVRSVRDMKLIQEEETRLLFKSSKSPLLVPPTSARTSCNLNGFIERSLQKEKTRLVFQSSESPLLVPPTSARICSNLNGFIKRPSRKDHENIARQNDALCLESATTTEMGSANSSRVDGLYHDDEDSGADCDSRVPSLEEYGLSFSRWL